MKTITFLDSMVYLARKAEQAELDAFDKDVVVKVAQIMQKNALTIIETCGYKGYSVSEVLYMAGAVVRQAQMDIFNPNAMKRLHDSWIKLQNEKIKYGIEA